MGKKYLNKNVLFQCGSGNFVFFRPQNCAPNVKINGVEALLDDCRLNLIGSPMVGQCKRQPNPATGTPPGFCTAVLVKGIWKNKVRLMDGGRGVLSSKCSISCPVGGKITPFFPTLRPLNADNNTRMLPLNDFVVSEAHADSEQTESQNDSVVQEAQADSKPTKSQKDKKISDLKKEAEEKLDKRVEELASKKDYKAAVVAAYDVESGEIAVKNSDIPPEKEDVHPLLLDLAEEAGGLGNKGIYEPRNAIGACAEFHAVNQLLRNGSKFENIRLTNAIRPRDKSVVPCCGNCKAMFKEIIEKS